MENDDFVDSLDHGTPKVLRSLVEFASSSELSGFDQIYEDYSTVQLNEFQFLSLTARETEEAAIQVHDHQSKKKSSRRMHSVSISMPASPLESHFQTSKQLLFSDHGNTIPIHRYGDSSAPPRVPISRLFSKQVKYDPRIGRMKDTRFDSFKTWSGKLEKQLSNLRGKPQGSRPEDGIVPNAEIETLPVERYFDALEGPELDTLRASEEIVLPHDKPWPFLLRYPVSSFGICLGISSQAILWKSLATSPSMKFLHVDLTMNLILWCISVALVAVVSLIYLMKVIFYFEAVRREYHHPVRVNFFFAPWISLLFLAIGSPPSVVRIIPVPLWYTLMVPIFCLELKIYGQWMLGGQRRLSRVANPSNHLSVIGNFVGAFLGASMGLREGPIFFFAVGLAHYAVLFVTLYQRLPTNETLPKELHPVFFLFVAAPSVASMAWAKIQGTFDYGSRIAYFIALFLYFLLAVRVNFFRGFRFSLAWWAYTFPMTSASITTITYANEVSSFVTQSLSVILFLATTITVTALLMTTMVHAFVLQALFPNDIAIAISEKRCGRHRKNQHRRQESLKAKGTESFSRFGSSESKDIEASLRSPMDDAGAV